MEESRKAKAKEYQEIRNRLRLGGLAVTFLMLGFVIVFGWTDLFYGWASPASNPYAVLAVYFLVFSLYGLLFSFPLDFYSGYILEHHYGLSNETPGLWFQDWIKKFALSFSLTLALVVALYFLIWRLPHTWWLWAWAGYAAVSLILGKLFPVLIIPIFYRYSPIADETLKRKIEALAGRYGVSISNVSSLNLSKTTKKANAAFTGFGKTKRVILADTLLDSFTHEEIEMVLAHELGHYKHCDIWKQFGFGLVLSFAGFWIAYQAIGPVSAWFGYSGAADVRAFPVLLMISFILGLVAGPLANALSRYAERRADWFALEATRNKGAFISAMTKLSEMNLADPEPNPVVEFLFYDHPSIGKRLKMAEQYA